MLYHRVGASLPTGGAYWYPGADPDQRDVRKAILNVMLNAIDERKALAALRAKEEIRSVGLNSNEKLKPIIEALKAHNEPISRFFNAGCGPELQCLDSQVAERILIDLADKRIVCIPVHDSFIVKAGHEAELREAMARATHEVIGVVVPVDRKCGPVRCEPA
jgi:hypothetical protein